MANRLPHRRAELQAAKFSAIALRLGLLACLAAAMSLPRTGSTAEPSQESLDFFEKEVRPLLVNRCFECHGPGDKIKGGLRLTSRSAILAGGETGPAAAPGKPAESLLIEAVKYQGFEMPPKAKLPDEDIGKLARWIELGLPWPAGDAAEGDSTGSASPREDNEFAMSDAQRSHWSFQSVRQIPPPPVQNATWPAGTVDRFILAGLESRGLTPNPPADKSALLRRASFDMIGLPPTPAETDAFLQDESPQAFERVVDRLLASPHYGEPWGRHWLDVVRYADTAGETADFPVPQAYKYRNYVIDAFNSDKPYDEFIREQIAGDLLAAEGPPEKYAERVAATGFVAISRRFGFDSQNYQHLTIADTIDTLGRSVLGLSIGCARCHDHKYDPVSAKDYYALYGIFASTRYAFPGSEEQKAPRDFVPLVPAAESQRLDAVKQTELARLDGEIKRLEAWDKEHTPLEAQLTAQVGFDGDFESQINDTAATPPWTSGGKPSVSADAQSPFTNVYAHGKRGVRFPNDAENNYVLQTVEPRSAANSTALYFNVDFRNVGLAAGANGTYRFYLGHGPGTSPALEVDVDGAAIFLRNGDLVEKLHDLQLGRWYNLQLTVDIGQKFYSGKLSGEDAPLVFSGKQLRPAWDGTVDTFFVDCYGHQPGIKPAHDVDNVAVRNTPFEAENAAATATLSPTDAERAERQTQLAEIRNQRRLLGAAKAEQAKVAAVVPYDVAYGVVEGTAANARIQKRGEPNRLGDEVPRRFLEILGGNPLPAGDAGSGRRQLAEWLVSADNPLSARVIVNRLWHYHFGHGLVATTSDFGLRGRRPSHPALLDYLAGKLMAEGWSLKSLHKEILLSRVYQMSSVSNPRGAEIDPANELFWRFDRGRIDAESVRDALLSIGGDLDPTVGGPHPFPPPNAWGFSQHAPFKAVYDSRQRSVYLMTQRIQRHPLLALFDGADPNVSTSERSSTTTPTQALFMMNDPLVHQQSALIAGRLLKERADDVGRLQLLYQLAFARLPREQEARAGAEFLTRYTAALQTAGVPAEGQTLAAWGALCRVIVTSNEFFYLD